jgi:hypothetical protein
MFERNGTSRRQSMVTQQSASFSAIAEATSLISVDMNDPAEQTGNTQNRLEL